ncbi:MAG: DUF881 domain-containing protein [Propioniciclava sp.]|uniref:DUF881 domain-containing protein n=1 Tax=Propioniciclava sp. TaxID=2038686 RepID=UPI0039E51F0D
MTSPPRPRPDASMDLLNTLRREALDPAYRGAHESGRAGHRPPVLLAAMLVVGLLFGVAVAQTWRGAPAAAQERRDLMARITDAEARADELRAHAASLTREVRDLERSSGAVSPEEAARHELLGLVSGSDAASGPGVRITLADGADAEDGGTRVMDVDLRMVANGLWACEAEAIAINGYRLSARTAIRNAGDAITVDYRSITGPYAVEAIGDARALEQCFRGTEGGVWVEGLAQHYGVVWGSERRGVVEVPADPGLSVDRAVKAP